MCSLRKGWNTSTSAISNFCLIPFIWTSGIKNASSSFQKQIPQVSWGFCSNYCIVLINRFGNPAREIHTLNFKLCETSKMLCWKTLSKTLEKPKSFNCSSLKKTIFSASTFVKEKTQWSLWWFLFSLRSCKSKSLDIFHS